MKTVTDLKGEYECLIPIRLGFLGYELPIGNKGIETVHSSSSNGALCRASA